MKWMSEFLMPSVIIALVSTILFCLQDKVLKIMALPNDPMPQRILQILFLLLVVSTWFLLIFLQKYRSGKKSYKIFQNENADLKELCTKQKEYIDALKTKNDAIAKENVELKQESESYKSRFDQINKSTHIKSPTEGFNDHFKGLA